jgi:HAD superfamily hydrolase (TIGR01509 family)
MKEFAVIFDMDGVIVHSNPYHKKSWKKFFQKHGLHLNEEDLRQHVYGKINSEILTHYFGKISQERIKEYVHEKESLFRKLIAPEISSPRGMHAFLHMLKKNYIICAVATSAPPENVRFVLQKFGIKKFFSVILDDSHVTKGKPNPEIYLKTAKLMNFPPKRCIVIEDSISGITSARRAGMKVIAITTTHTKKELSEADVVIDDFTTLTLQRLQKVAK